MKHINENLNQVILWLILGLVPQLAWTEVPNVVNYQGYLVNTNGEPLSATVNMTFALYATAQGDSALWTETHQQVEITNGVFSLILGNTTSFDNESLEGKRYLGVTVGGDPEMAPRQQLTSAFFAMRAGVAESVKAATVGTEAITDGAVTAEKIALQTITGDKIADLSGHNVTELDGVTDVGSGKIISDAEREKLASLTPGGNGGSPIFENLNVKNELKVGEHTLYQVVIRFQLKRGILIITDQPGVSVFFANQILTLLVRNFLQSPILATLASAQRTPNTNWM
jgi:hypothetical protein